MTDHDKLRESMWDLVYGLLSADESAALIARIKSDPQAARLYAEVRLQADLVGAAARVEDGSVVLQPDRAADSPTPAKRSRAKPAAAAALDRQGDNPRGGAWLAGLVATALAVLLAAGVFWPQPDLQQIAMNFVVAEVEAPQAMTEGLEHAVMIRTRSLSGEGRPAKVDLRIVAEGRPLYRQRMMTDDLGRAAVTIPGEVLEPGARLELDAAPAEAAAVTSGRRSEIAAQGRALHEAASNATSLAADLAVAPEPHFAYFLFEQPVVERGEAVRFGQWNVGAYSGKLVEAELPRSEVEDLASAAPAGDILGRELQLPLPGVVQGIVRAEESGVDAYGLAQWRALGSYLPESGERLYSIPESLREGDGYQRGRAETLTEGAPALADGRNLADRMERLDRKLSMQGDEGTFDERNESLLSRSKAAERDETEGQPAARRLEVNVAELRERYEPGERVRLELEVTDEAGQPAAGALLGVRVWNWNEQVAQVAATQPVMLALKLTKEAAPAATNGAQALAFGATVDAEASGALAAGAGGFGRQADFASGLAILGDNLYFEQRGGLDGAAPPAALTYYSNRDAAEGKYQAAVAAARERRAAIVSAIGSLLLFGGAIGLVLLVLLALFRMPAGTRTAAPVVAAAAASVVAGLIWVGWIPQPALQVAMAPAQMATDEALPPEAAARPEGAPAGQPPRFAAPLLDRMGDEALSQSATEASLERLATPLSAAEEGGRPALPPPTIEFFTPGEPADGVATAPEVARRATAPGEAAATEKRLADSSKTRDKTRFMRQQEGESPARSAAGAFPYAPPADAAPDAGVAAGQESLKSETPAAESEDRQSALQRPAASGPATPAPPDDVARQRAASRSAVPPARDALPAPPAPDSPLPAAITPPPPPAPAGRTGGLADDVRPQLARGGFLPAPAPAAGGQAGGRGGFPADSLGLGGARLPEFQQGQQRMNDRGVAREAGDAAPPSLYFNPQLIADSRGRVAIEFVMPPAESEYRLLIDALGHGRLGSAAYPLVCRGE